MIATPCARVLDNADRAQFMQRDPALARNGGCFASIHTVRDTPSCY
jgi:hypothetical protein